MRAAIFNGAASRVSIETIDVPTPKPGEVLLKVCRCGVCGSDLSLTAEGAPFKLDDGRFGHEYAGEVVEVGQGVTSHRPGDRVAVLPIGSCGRCEACRNSSPFFCSQQRLISGGFGEYVAAPAAIAMPMPDGMSFGDGALVEPMACGVHALRMAGVTGGERILVLGAGAVSLAVVYWARRMGAGRIVALSRTAARYDVLMEMGCDAVLGFEDHDRARLEEALGGPPDIVAEGVGKAGMIQLAVDLVRPQGTVLSMGMCMHGDAILPAQCGFKEIRLLFPMSYTRVEFLETLRAFEAGRARPEAMVGEVIGLEALPRRLDEMRATSPGVKVHVDPTRSA